ncbi:hypothetical protein AYI68_g6984 [Smittium mucronatum]|uniref:Uncharacterized protein n=1 Tax=Smittium mucronatum TaxID=133383 RepID=A0A1R0GPZ2_9FUNG|nr:hypothetical protein AYI68_g6984 [Smittium mucronatum]
MENEFNLPAERSPTSEIASSSYPNVGLIDMAFLKKVLDVEIRLNFERWTCALDDISAVLNDRFLLFLDGPLLE